MDDIENKKEYVNDAFFYWLKLRFSRSTAFENLRLVNVLFEHVIIDHAMFDNVLVLRETLRDLVKSSNKFFHIAPNASLLAYKENDTTYMTEKAMKYKDYSDLYQTSYYKYVYSVNLYAEFLGKSKFFCMKCRRLFLVELDIPSRATCF